jgi:hypothetical protein
VTDRRTLWFAPDLGIEDEPLIVSLWKYRQWKNRYQVDEGSRNQPYDEPNLVSSLTEGGKQMPILDLDYEHHMVSSTSEGHTHFYIDTPMSKWRWFVLMCALRYAGVIELGFFVWSIRRGGNFVRLPGVSKRGDNETRKATYGWFRRLK